jgi:NitT/TauT family transport system ATP-binding protein
MPPTLEPLPTTGISKMLSLLEVLDDHGGKDDLYRLSQDLHTPFSELLLVVKGAEMLDLCVTSREEVRLTDLGKEVFSRSLQEKKALLRRQMMRLQTFQHVVKLLENAKGRELAAEVIREQLAVLLPQEQPRELFTTLLNWGRYGEVFGYSRETDTFFLHKEAPRG